MIVRTDLFEIDPAAAKTHASLLASRLAHAAKPKTPEQTLRIAFQGAVDEIARKLKFNLDWRDEYLGAHHQERLRSVVPAAVRHRRGQSAVD
jgi:hypothetical protein